MFQIVSESYKKIVSGEKYARIMIDTQCSLCFYKSTIHKRNLQSKLSALCRCEQARGCESKVYKGYKELSLSYFNHIKYGAKKRNLEFSISIEEVYKLLENQNFRCALSGLPIKIDASVTSKGKRLKTQTASIDRIDSSKGYTIDNVQWIHKDLQFMKTNMSDEKFICLCKIVANNNPSY